MTDEKVIMLIEAKIQPRRRAELLNRCSAATGCTCETGPEEHQGHYANYLHKGRAGRLLGKARIFTL